MWTTEYATEEWAGRSPLLATNRSHMAIVTDVEFLIGEGVEGRPNTKNITTWTGPYAILLFFPF